MNDHPQQAEVAGKLMAELASARRGFICREVSVELARNLDRAYGYSRNRIATAFKELAATRATDDTIRAADGYRRGGPDFAEQMIAAAAKRSSANTLYTLDRQDGQLRATALSPAACT